MFVWHSQSPTSHNLSVAEQAHNANTREVEGERPEAEAHPQMHVQFQTALSHRSLYNLFSFEKQNNTLDIL